MSEKREIKTTLAIDGEKQFKAAMDDAYRGLRVLGSEMKATTATYADNANSTEALTKKNEVLGKQISQQKEIVAALAKAVDESSQAYGENDKKTDAYRIKLNNAEAALAGMENELNKNEKALENVGKATEDTDKKTKNWRESLEKVKEGIDGAIGVLTPIAAGIAAMGAAAVGAAKQMWDATVETGKFADEMLTTAQVAGIGVETLQEWRYAAQFIDTEVTVMTGSVAKMTKQLASAREGTGASAEAFAMLGVEIKQADGSLRNANDIFFDAIDALGQIENETERDVLAMQLFGKSAKDLTPLINAGAEELRRLGQEAQDLGVVMAEDTVQRFGEFDDGMNRLNSTIDGVKRSFITALLPAMEAVIPVVQDLIGQFREWLKSDGAQQLLLDLTDKIKGVVNWLKDNLSTALDSIIGTFDTVIKTVGWLIEHFDTIITVGGVVIAMLTGLKVAQAAVNMTMAANPIGAVILAITALITAIVLLIKNWDNVKETVIKVWDTIKNTVSTVIESIIGFFGDLFNHLLDFPKKMLEIGVNMIKGIWEGIKSMATWFWEKLKEWFADALGWIGKLLGIKSPSRVMAEQIGKPMAQGVAQGISQNAGLVDKAMEELIPDTRGMLDVVGNFDRLAGPVKYSGKSTMTVTLDESGLDRLADKIIRGMENVEFVAMMNDREMGRYIRRVSTA